MIRRLFGRSSLTGSNWINSGAQKREGGRGSAGWCKGAGKVVIDKEGEGGERSVNICQLLGGGWELKGYGGFGCLSYALYLVCGGVFAVFTLHYDTPIPIAEARPLLRS